MPHCFNCVSTVVCLSSKAQRQMLSKTSLNTRCCWGGPVTVRCACGCAHVCPTSPAQHQFSWGLTCLLFRWWYIRCVILLSQCIWCPTFSCAATTRWPSQVTLDWFQVTVLLLVFFFFFLLLINCWCAVSNLTIIHGSWISCSCQLSSALSMFWWMEILQAVACICVFKKKKTSFLNHSFVFSSNCPDLL